MYKRRSYDRGARFVVHMTIANEYGTTTRNWYFRTKKPALALEVKIWLPYEYEGDVNVWCDDTHLQHNIWIGRRSTRRHKQSAVWDPLPF